ncbi:MAG: YncE family protein [Phycisphaeraceae bacterium]|nr:YncE family protein [Phycisphaeraceae bacterium]
MCENKKSENTGTAKVRPLTLWCILILWVCLTSPVLGQHYAYVTNAGDFGDDVGDDLSIVDLATNAVVATVPVGSFPQGVAVNPAGTAVYVANSMSNDFTVIDTMTHTATTLAAGLNPTGVTVHPDGTRIYLANTDFFGEAVSTVSVLDRATNTVIDEIFCGNGSITVSVHPDGTVAYVLNAFDGTMTVLDTDTHEVVDTIVLETVGADEPCVPVPVVVHPAGTYVYVANRQGPTIWAINTATHESIAGAFGNAHVGIGINPAGTVLYLPDFDDADPNLLPQGTTVDVIDAHTLEGITTIDGFNAPVDVSVHPDGTQLYVTNGGNDTVSVIDTVTYALMTTIDVGFKPCAYGECVGPGVPRLLKADAVARLEAVKVTIEGDTEGVVSPLLAIEYLESALDAGNFGLRENLWSASDAENLDPRRLHVSLGSVVFETGQAMVEATLDTIRRGWIMDAELHVELLAIVDQAVRADRVLAAVVIDDAIVGQKNSETIEQAQALLEKGDALVKEAKVWEQMDKKATLLTDAISQYQAAWQAAQQ